MIANDRKLKNTLSFMTAMILTAGVIFCLSFVKNELNITAITATYNLDIRYFISEKSEKLQYIFGTLSFPVFYIAAQLFLSKKSFNSHKQDNALDWCGFILINILTFIIIIKTPLLLNALAYIPQNDSGILGGASKYIFSFIPLIIAYVLFAVYALYENLGKGDTASVERKRSKKKLCDAAIYTVAAVNLIFIPYLYITKTYYFNHITTSTHFDAYFYPVYKVFCGQTPLVDFDSLYGFYPYFLVPLFKLTGGISMLRFSIVMSILVFIILLAITILLFKICTNKYLALLGTLVFTLAVAVLPMFYGEIYYLQYFPHRVLFPVLILVLCVITTRLKRSNALKAMTFAGYAISALSLLWNLDTGIVVLLAFAGFRLYLLLLKYDFKEKGLYRGVAGIVLYTAISVAAALFILIFITYERTGKLLHFADILYSMTSFYGMGYYMIRMPLWSAWMLLAGLYAFSLAKALRNMKFMKHSTGEQGNKKDILLFLLPVIGMGIFSYYQGRSHFLVLLAVIWPGVLLLVLMMDEFGQAIKEFAGAEHRIHGTVKYKFFAVFFMIALLVSNFIFHAIVPFELQGAKDKIHTAATTQITPVMETIKEVREGNEPLDLITFHSAAIYCIMGDTRIANVPATIDWFTKTDYQKVFDYLSKTENKVIFDKGSMDTLQKYEPEKLQAVLTRFNLVLKTADCWVYTEKS